MPTIKTIVSDLRHRRARGVGIGPTRIGHGGVDIPLSEADHVIELSSPVNVQFGAVPLTRALFPLIDPPGQPDGRWLWYKDDWSAVATLNRNCKIAVGGDFRGCYYSVFYAGRGEFKCVHTSRPLGANNQGSDRWVAYLERYALDRNWTRIQGIPTHAQGGVVSPPGCVGFFFVTRIHYNINPIQVHTVRLALDNMNCTLAAYREITPVPNAG